jgi:hypothetical protein
MQRRFVTSLVRLDSLVSRLSLKDAIKFTWIYSWDYNGGGTLCSVEIGSEEFFDQLGDRVFLFFQIHDLDYFFNALGGLWVS